MSLHPGDPSYRSRYGLTGGRTGSRRSPTWFRIGAAAWVAVVLALVWWVTA